MSQVSKKKKKEVKKYPAVTNGPLFYLLIGNLIWNIGWLIALAGPCFMLITEAGGAKGAFGVLIMVFFLIFAIFILAIMFVHVMSIIAIIKMKAGEFDKIKLYYVGSIAWVVLSVFHFFQEPDYRMGSVPSAIIGLALVIAMKILVEKEIEKNNSTSEQGI